MNVRRQLFSSYGVPTMTDRLVVVGASLSGIKAVRDMRALGFEGDITMVGAEDELPYDRPPLSKGFLAGECEVDDLLLATEAQMQELRVDFVRGDPAVLLNEESNAVTLSSGRILPYDSVLITTGADPNRPSWFRELPGLHLLRSVSDARAIRDGLRQGERVVIVGGGFIGTEAAAKLCGLGKEVTIVTDGDSVLEPLGRELASRFTALHRSRRVEVVTGSLVVEVIGDDRAHAVRLLDGTVIETDSVLVAVGARPNSTWVAQLADPLTGAVQVQVDGRVRGNVWAAGDVTTTGVGHWFSAVRQSKRVARGILGIVDKSTLRLDSEVPYMWTDQFELKVQILGSVERADNFAILDQECDATPANLVGLYHKDGIISGAVLIDRPQVLGALRKLVAMGGTLGDAADLFGSGVRS